MRYLQLAPIWVGCSFFVNFFYSGNPQLGLGPGGILLGPQDLVTITILLERAPRLVVLITIQVKQHD